MININNKPWEKLRLSDIEKFLSSSTDENFFYEKNIENTTSKNG